MEQSLCPKNNRTRHCHDFINLNITLGLVNTSVHRGKYGKPYYAQFAVETSEKYLVDFRRILISTLHQGQQSFDLKVEVMSPTMIIYCSLKSEDYVGVDVIKEIKPHVDAKNYISLAGSSLISAQTNKGKESVREPQATENKKSSVNDYSLEEFEFDPRIWDEIDSLSLSSTTSVPKHLVTTPCGKVSSNLESSKKRAPRKKKNPDEL